MRTASTVLVTDDAASTAGGATWWSFTGPISRAALVAAWAKHGLAAGQLPRPHGSDVALHRAVADHRGGDVMVRQLPGAAGWAVVEESHVFDDESGRKTLAYSVALEVRRNTGDEGATPTAMSGALTFVPADHPLRAEIEAAVARHEGELSPADLGTWLVRQVRMLNGVALRNAGGFYFLPRVSLDDWRTIIAALEEAATPPVVVSLRCTVCGFDVADGCLAHPSAEIAVVKSEPASRAQVDLMPALRCDEAIGAIAAAVAQDAAASMRELRLELADSSKPLGARGLATRQARALDVLRMLSAYDELLGDALVTMKATGEALRDDIAKARQQAERSQAPQGVSQEPAAQEVR
jgi:hypothetical protein